MECANQWAAQGPLLANGSRPQPRAANGARPLLRGRGHSTCTWRYTGREATWSDFLVRRAGAAGTSAGVGAGKVAGGSSSHRLVMDVCKRQTWSEQSERGPTLLPPRPGVAFSPPRPAEDPRRQEITDASLTRCQGIMVLRPQNSPGRLVLFSLRFRKQVNHTQ